MLRSESTTNPSCHDTIRWAKRRRSAGREIRELAGRPELVRQDDRPGRMGRRGSGPFADDVRHRVPARTAGGDGVRHVPDGLAHPRSIAPGSHGLVELRDGRGVGADLDVGERPSGDVEAHVSSRRRRPATTSRHRAWRGRLAPAPAGRSRPRWSCRRMPRRPEVDRRTGTRCRRRRRRSRLLPEVAQSRPRWRSRPSGGHHAGWSGAPAGRGVDPAALDHPRPRSAVGGSRSPRSCWQRGAASGTERSRTTPDDCAPLRP